MGKRKHGFLTAWQRDLLTGLVKLKASPKVDVKQRKRIEMREIHKSYLQAIDDFRIYEQWGIQSEEVIRSYSILKRFKRWGRMKREHVDIRITCPKCGFRMSKSYAVSEDGELWEPDTFGVPRKRKEAK